MSLSLFPRMKKHVTRGSCLQLDREVHANKAIFEALSKSAENIANQWYDLTMMPDSLEPRSALSQ